MKLLCFTTCDNDSKRLEKLYVMVESLQQVKLRNPDVDVHAYLLIQRCSEEDFQYISSRIPDFFRVFHLNSRVSLSRARNILLGHAGHEDFTGAIVAFPDDDCWYPFENLDRIIFRFKNDYSLDYLFCRYSFSPVEFTNKLIINDLPSVFKVAAFASSNTFFARGDLIKKSGFFDEDLGVGAKYNGGEDTDYALRIFSIAEKCEFINEPLIGHRDPDPTLKGVYYPGALLAIASNARFVKGGWKLFIKKILVGGHLVITGKVPIGKYGNLLIISLKRFFQSGNKKK